MNHETTRDFVAEMLVRLSNVVSRFLASMRSKATLAQVNQEIKKQLTVYTQEVPIEKGRGIKNLRAVFGEQSSPKLPGSTDKRSSYGIASQFSADRFEDQAYLVALRVNMHSSKSAVHMQSWFLNMTSS